MAHDLSVSGFKSLWLPQGLEDLLETVEGLLQTAQPVAQPAFAQMGGVHCGVRRDGVIIRAQRFLESPELFQCVALPQVRFSAGGASLKSADKTFQRLLRAPRFHQRLTPVERFPHLGWLVLGGPSAGRRFTSLPTSACRARVAFEL